MIAFSRGTSLNTEEANLASHSQAFAQIRLQPAAKLKRGSNFLKTLPAAESR